MGQDRSWLSKYRTEQGILIVLGLLDIIDFFGKLNADLEFVKYIISWTMFGYLMYHTSLSRIFFGRRLALVDSAILGAYFMLMAYKLVALARLSMGEHHISAGLHSLYSDLIAHSPQIVSTSFGVGFAACTILAIVVGWQLRFEDPSVASVLHLPLQPPKEFQKKMVRILTSFLIIFGFFLTVFNLMAEWLSIALDAPIFVFSLVIYLLFISRRVRIIRTERSEESWLSKVEGAAEEFYSNFLSHFVYKETLLLGLGGMLVLHVLTDAGNFLLPYLLGFTRGLYLDALGPGHDALFTLWRAQAASFNFAGQTLLVLVYIANVVALAGLLILPAFMWYIVYREKQVHIRKSWLVIFYAALPAYLLAPIFAIRRAPDTFAGLGGIDISSQPIPGGLSASIMALGIGAALAILVITLSKQHAAERLCVGAGIILSFAFFAYYVAYYLLDLALEYWTQLVWLLEQGQFALGGAMGIVLALSVALNVAGFLAFSVAILKKTHHYLKY